MVADVLVWVCGEGGGESEAQMSSLTLDWAVALWASVGSRGGGEGCASGVVMLVCFEEGDVEDGWDGGDWGCGASAILTSRVFAF